MKFKTTVFELPDDYEGRVVATLVEAHPGQPSDKAVLYLHGYIDYFFQEHLAQRIVADGRSFFALELRKYGRSLLPHQHFNYCRDLHEYYPEIDRAIAEIRRQGNGDLTLVAHSTGGLLASLYCADGRERAAVSRLLLNSPFLEFNANGWMRRVEVPVAGFISRFFPYISMKNKLNDNYFLSVHASGYGEWDFDLRYKPRTVPLYFAWLRAIRKGHRRVKRGLDLRIPVLVMYSGKSSYEKGWDEAALSGDTVLNVKHIEKYALRLGRDVEREVVEGGLHDLVLSRKEIRERVLERMVEFMQAENKHM